MESLKGLTLHKVGDFVQQILKNQQLKYDKSFQLPCSSSARNFPIDFSALCDHITNVIAPQFPSYHTSDSYSYTKNLIKDYICLWCRTEDKQYFCPNCTQSYSTVSKYKVHFRKTHMTSTSKTPISKIQCEICGKPVSKLNIRPHMLTHASLEVVGNKCDHCGQSYRTKKTLQIHINTKHNQTRIYTCPYCQIQFKTSHTRTSHIHKKHLNEKVIYKCSECPANFKAKSSLKGHIQLKHTDPSGLVQLECLQCKRKYQTQYQFQIHKYGCRNKGKRQKWVCPICSKTLSTKIMKSDHIRIHTGELPYKCDAPGCEKRFRTWSNLNQHSKIHRKDKPYCCPECQLQFRLPHHLRNHLKTLTHARMVKKPSKVVEMGDKPLERTTHTYFLRRVLPKTNL